MPTGKTKIELLVESKVRDALRDLDKTEKEIDGIAKAGSRASDSFKGWATAAPDWIRVRKYYININREINIPDTDRFNTFNRTRKGEFDPKN